jgi:hypothetical protein
MAPADGVTAELRLAAPSVPGGAEFPVAMHFANSSDAAVGFTLNYVGGLQAVVIGPDRGANLLSDMIAFDRIELAPGARASRPVTVTTTTCADTADQPAPPLATGTYGASVTLYFSDVTVARPSANSSDNSSPSPSPSPGPDRDPWGNWSFASSFLIT